MINLVVLAVGLLAYFIGAIPIGYIIAYLKGVKDIRQHGSGNVGATNVSRLLGAPYFFLIFFIDAGKAFLFMHLIMSYFPHEYLYFFATILLLGNTCSIFLRGSGGKGVATLFGLVSALHLTAAGVLLGVWCVSMATIHIVGMASVIAVASLPMYAVATKNYLFFMYSCMFALWIAWLHRSNIWTYWEKRCTKRQ